MQKIIDAFEKLKYPDLVAKSLNMTDLELRSAIEKYSLDIRAYEDNLNKEISLIDISTDFNVVLAYKHKRFPQIIDEALCDKTYDLINRDTPLILNFLKELKEKKVSYYDFIYFIDKIETYGKILNRFCKTSLRKKTDSVKWDSEINSFCKRYNSKIQNFNKKGYSLTYNDVLDSFLLKKDTTEIVVPVEKPFLFMLQDILKIKNEDLHCLIPYYMALKNHKDSETITKIWIFSKLLTISDGKNLLKS